MKPALYYAIRTFTLFPHVIAVTTQKRRTWYGRDCRDNSSTSGMLDHIKGKFDKLEDAEVCRAGVAKISVKYKEARDVLAREVRKLHSQENDDIKRYIEACSNNE